MFTMLMLFAQRPNFNTGPNPGDAAAGGAMLAGQLCACGFELIVLALIFASWWKIFDKAGEPGWAAIVPIYNMIVMCRIAGKPEWWVLLLLIPFVNFVIGILVMIGLAENFGKSGAFAVGLILLGIVFLPILAFGDAQFQGPGGGGGNYGRRRSRRRDDYDDEDEDEG
jgi:Family of unknown function (DUF5684)